MINGNAKLTTVVIEDESFSRQFLKSVLEEMGCRYVGLASIAEARAYLEKEDAPELIMLDVRLPDGNGLDLFSWVSEQQLPTSVIIMTAFGTINEAVEAMKAGAYDFIAKPFDDLNKIRAALKNALEHARLKKENQMLRAQLETPPALRNLVGKSKAMQSVFFLVQKAAQTNSNVLIEGGSGTGKELVAKAIHDLGERKKNNFVPVNCGALPENLLEAALFGHEKGAFTGADKLTKGFFEEADGGTLFLDEIGDAPLSVQVKVLRAVEYGTIYRVGSTRPLSVDVRFLFATHKDLSQQIDRGLFREDLYYRMNVISISLPSLAEKRSDVPALVKHFADKICLSLGGEQKEFTQEAIDYLRHRDWPGNVRELKNFIERVIALHSGKLVTLDDMTSLGTQSISVGSKSIYDVDFDQAKHNFERMYFEKLLERCSGDLDLAIDLSGVHRATIYRKIKDYNLKFKI